MTNLHIANTDTEHHIPDHWDEITDPAVVKYCLTQALHTAAGHQTILQAQIKALYQIASIHRSWRTIVFEKIMPATWVESKNAAITDLAKTVSAFLFTNPDPDPGTPVEINYDTILNHFPVIRPSVSLFRTLYSSLAPQYAPPGLYGPADLLSDLTFGEFRAALEELDQYYDQVTPADTAPTEAAHHQLSRFIACLYRTERIGYAQVQLTDTYDGRRREPFNRSRISHHATIADHLDPTTRTAILLWFTNCIHYIQTQEIIISGRTISLRSLFPKSKTTTTPIDPTIPKTGGGWTSILYNLAKDGIFGDATATDRTALFDILIYMYDQHREAQRLKAKYAKKH